MSRRALIAVLPLLMAFSCVATRNYVVREGTSAAPTAFEHQNLEAIFKTLPATKAVQQVACVARAPCEAYRLRRSNENGWWDAYISLTSDSNGAKIVTISNGTGPTEDIRILKAQLEVALGQPGILMEK